MSTVDLFLGVLSDPALSRAGEVSEFECLRAVNQRAGGLWMD